MINVALRSLTGVEEGSEGTAHLGSKTQVIKATSDLKASFLWASFHGTRNCCASCQWREATNTAVTAGNPSITGTVSYE